jgi:hypothetical protein
MPLTPPFYNIYSILPQQKPRTISYNNRTERFKKKMFVRPPCSYFLHSKTNITSTKVTYISKVYYHTSYIVTAICASDMLLWHYRQWEKYGIRVVSNGITVISSFVKIGFMLKWRTHKYTQRCTHIQRSLLSNKSPFFLFKGQCVTTIVQAFHEGHHYLQEQSGRGIIPDIITPINYDALVLIECNQRVYRQ